MSESKAKRPRTPLVPRYDSAPPETVDPRWILKAAAAVLALGLLCAYLALCSFFYVQQWQFVLHPSRTVAQTPAALGLPFTDVRFGPDNSGQPQLTGFWIPGDEKLDPVVLLLHGERGSMSDALPIAAALHAARVNVLVFDYRGYGKSGGAHPTQMLMQEDAQGAYLYLTQVRRIAPKRILVFGQDLGASLAVRLCGEHPEIAGLITLDADGDTASRVEADQRSRVVPIGLLFHERFPLADALHRLATPKLLISDTRGPAPEIAKRAADPKLTVEVPPGSGSQPITDAVRRFISSYIPHPPTLLEEPLKQRREGSRSSGSPGVA